MLNKNTSAKCRIPVVLVRVSIVVKKHHDQKASWGGKDLFGLHFHSTEVRIGTQTGEDPGGRRQELMHRPWRGAAYCLASHVLLSLLSYRILDHQPRD